MTQSSLKTSTSRCMRCARVLKQELSSTLAESCFTVSQDLAATHPVEYIAGGATQNSIRVAQWMSQKPGMTAYVGCIGKDKFGEQLEAAARADGVNVQYMKQDKEVTGTCAVLVKGGERSLCANLAAANCYDIQHFETEAIQVPTDHTRQHPGNMGPNAT